MWVLAEYEATSLFSLKSSKATSSGGKSLLLPSPFALKMALLDVACRTEGLAVAREAWAWMRALKVAVRPSPRVVVNNVFTRILKPSRSKPREGYPDQGPLQRTIGYREYVQLAGAFTVALGGEDNIPTGTLKRWLAGINYLGKRGSFVQLLSVPQTCDELPADFVATSESATEELPLEGVLQVLDDCGTDTPFDRVDIYSGKNLRPGKDRVSHHVVLPYRIASSSRGYTFYERVTM